MTSQMTIYYQSSNQISTRYKTCHPFFFFFLNTLAMKKSFGIILYTSIIIFLMLLTVVTVGTSALDIIIQALKADPKNKTFVIIAGGSYFLTVQFYLTRLIL